MSIYANLDDGKQIQVASNQGWTQVIDALEDTGYPTIEHLTQYGWTEEIPQLREELSEIHANDHDVKTVLKYLAGFLEGAADDAVLIISDGLGPNTTTQDEIDTLAQQFIQELLGEDAKLSLDPSGHQHKGKGEGGGQFTSGGSTGNVASSTDADSKIQSWAALAAKIPEAIYAKAKQKVKDTFAKFEGRYGRKMAIAIVGAAIVGTAIPLPGTTMLAMAPLIGAAELYRHFRGSAALSMTHLPPQGPTPGVDELDWL